MVKTFTQQRFNKTKLITITMRYIITRTTTSGNSFESKAPTKDQAMALADYEAGTLETASVVITDTLTGFTTRVK